MIRDVMSNIPRSQQTFSIQIKSDIVGPRAFSFNPHLSTKSPCKSTKKAQTHLPIFRFFAAWVLHVLAHFAEWLEGERDMQTPLSFGPPWVRCTSHQ